jgi:hypothetical protein
MIVMWILQSLKTKRTTKVALFFARAKIFFEKGIDKLKFMCYNKGTKTKGNDNYVEMSLL